MNIICYKDLYNIYKPHIKIGLKIQIKRSLSLSFGLMHNWRAILIPMRDFQYSSQSEFILIFFLFQHYIKIDIKIKFWIKYVRLLNQICIWMARGFIPGIYFIIKIKIFIQNIHNLFANPHDNRMAFVLFRCTDKVQSVYGKKKKHIVLAGLSQHCYSCFLNHFKPIS